MKRSIHNDENVKSAIMFDVQNLIWYFDEIQTHIGFNQRTRELLIDYQNIS